MILLKKIRVWIADILFLVGHQLIILSALTMGYKDTAKELKKAYAHWLKANAFKTKNY